MAVVIPALLPVFLLIVLGFILKRGLTRQTVLRPSRCPLLSPSLQLLHKVTGPSKKR